MRENNKTIIGPPGPPGPPGMNQGDQEPHVIGELSRSHSSPLHADDAAALLAGVALTRAQARGADLTFDPVAMREVSELALSIGNDPRAPRKTRLRCFRMLANLEQQRVANLISLGRLVLDRDKATRSVVEDGAARVQGAAVQVNTYTGYPGANGAPVLPPLPPAGSALAELDAGTVPALPEVDPTAPSRVIPWAPDPMSGGPKAPPKPRKPRKIRATTKRARKSRR